MSMLDATYAYRAIVFALKRPHTLDTLLQGKKLLKYRNCIISEHPPSEDNLCEWEGLHYHGIVEHPERYRFDSDRIFNQFKTEHCEWFKSEQCKMPVNFLAYIQVPPRRIVFRNYEDSKSDLSFLETQITDELLLEVSKRKEQRINNRLSGNNDIMYIKDLILKSNAQSESELVNLYHSDPNFENIYCKRTFSTNFKKALTFAIQVTLDSPIRDLCINYSDKLNECMQPRNSARLMELWCEFQGIDPQQFVYDVIDCLDKKKRKLNTLILKGEPNSGKTFIAKSLQKAVRFYGEVTQGLSGYNFMWQDCVNKRLIVINEPYFDECMIEQLKVVLEGTGCFVHKKNNSDEYLRPTPVVITTNNDVWQSCPFSRKAIEVRCIRIYNNLKPCHLLKAIKKDLHPQWLSILAVKYAKAASPVSDFSDDECLSTSLAIDTADPAPKPDSPNSPEVQPIDLTVAAKNTTNTSPTLKGVKRRLIDDFNAVPQKKEDLPETCSQDLFPSKNTSEGSIQFSINYSQDLSPTPEEEKPAKKTKVESTNSSKQRNFDPERSTENHLEQDNKDYQICRDPVTNKWTTWRSSKEHLEE
uniref:Nonstructural protein n=1 Tax=Emberiza spodocephala parvoviridae sp. TaxID=2794481 RepID=A0A8E7G2L8_9VIRU|nr:MAG: nonstructural protein [Emberiza spodocephala parvoviridae sp.]